MLEKDEEVSFLKVKLRPGISKLNFFTFLLSQFITYMVVSYLLVLAILLLQENYEVKSEDIGRIAGGIGTYTEIIVIFYSIFIGYVFDTFGRKLPCIVGLLACAVGLIALPFGKQVYPTFFLLRTLISLGLITNITSPFIPDYVVESSQGRASSYNTLMIIFSRILTSYGILKLSEIVSLDYIFVVTGILVLVFTVFIFFTLKDVKVSKENKVEIDPELKNKEIKAALTKEGAPFYFSFGVNFVTKLGAVIIGTFTLLLYTNEYEKKEAKDKLALVSLIS